MIDKSIQAEAMTLDIAMPPNYIIQRGNKLNNPQLKSVYIPFIGIPPILAIG